MKKKTESGTDLTSNDEKEISAIAGASQNMMKMRTLKFHPFVNKKSQENMKVSGLKENKPKCVTTPKRNEEPDRSAVEPIM